MTVVSKVVPVYLYLQLRSHGTMTSHVVFGTSRDFVGTWQLQIPFFFLNYVSRWLTWVCSCCQTYHNALLRLLPCDLIPSFIQSFLRSSSSSLTAAPLYSCSPVRVDRSMELCNFGNLDHISRLKVAWPWRSRHANSTCRAWNQMDPSNLVGDGN